MSNSTIIIEAKAKNQGFLVLALSALCLLFAVPALMLMAHVAPSVDAQRYLLLGAFVPAVGGFALAILGNRILSGKAKTF